MATGMVFADGFAWQKPYQLNATQLNWTLYCNSRLGMANVATIVIIKL